MRVTELMKKTGRSQKVFCCMFDQQCNKLGEHPLQCFFCFPRTSFSLFLGDMINLSNNSETSGRLLFFILYSHFTLIWMYSRRIVSFESSICISVCLSVPVGHVDVLDEIFFGGKLVHTKSHMQNPDHKDENMKYPRIPFLRIGFLFA